MPLFISQVITVLPGYLTHYQDCSSFFQVDYNYGFFYLGGTVITDEWKGHEEQKWTIFEHPRGTQVRIYSIEILYRILIVLCFTLFKDHLALVFVNYAVPYNDLSGYEELEDNPGIFPRPLTLNKHRIMPDLKREHAVQLQEDHFPVPWQIIIRNRWCLQNNG